MVTSVVRVHAWSRLIMLDVGQWILTPTSFLPTAERTVLSIEFGTVPAQHLQAQICTFQNGFFHCLTWNFPCHQLCPTHCIFVVKCMVKPGVESLDISCKTAKGHVQTAKGNKAWWYQLVNAHSMRARCWFVWLTRTSDGRPKRASGHIWAKFYIGTYQQLTTGSSKELKWSISH